MCKVDTGSCLPFSLGTGSGREWGSPTDLLTARRPCFPPQNRAHLGDPCGTWGGVCAWIAPSQTTNSCPAAGHRGGFPSVGVLWSGQCCRCFKKLDGLTSSFLHKTPPSPAAQPSAALNGRPASTPLHPSIRIPARRPLGAFRSSRPSDMEAWGDGGCSRNDSQWPRARRGQEDWFFLCTLGPHGNTAKGRTLGTLLGGGVASQEPGPQAGPQAPCLPASYSEHDFGFIRSGVFHEEKHWTFCPRLSREPGQPRRPQECSQSFHVGLCLHSPALSPLCICTRKDGGFPCWLRSHRPGDRVGRPRPPVPTGGLLGHGLGEGSHPGFFPTRSSEACVRPRLRGWRFRERGPELGATAWPAVRQAQLCRPWTVPPVKAARPVWAAAA